MSYILSSNPYRLFPGEALGLEKPVSGVKLELNNKKGTTYEVH